MVVVVVVVEVLVVEEKDSLCIHFETAADSLEKVVGTLEVAVDILGYNLEGVDMLVAVVAEDNRHS